MTSTLLQLAKADVERSGLTWNEVKELGAHELTAREVQSLGHPQALGAVCFPYWDPFNNEFMPLPVFHRIRYIEEPTGFAAQTKLRRYSQPPGTTNAVYVPRIVAGKVFDWKTYLEDPKGELFITEGEKKSAAACKKGIHCIGLGGVDVFQSSKKGLDTLPILCNINFRGRSVGVVFDSDVPEGLKPSVLKSAHRLLDWLMVQGARPYLVMLPFENNMKVGLDDYLLDHDYADFLALSAVSTMRHSDATALAYAAQQYRYIIDIDRFVGDDPQLLIVTPHLDRILSLRQVAMPRMERGKDPVTGSLTTRMLPTVMTIAPALLVWPGTQKFNSMVYAPGQDSVVHIEDRIHLNVWRGWRCEYIGKDNLPSPARRDVIMHEWLWAIDNIFADDPIAREFAEHWLMYPLKHAGAKHNTFAMICSVKEGIGKSFIGHMLAKHVYGLVRPGVRHAWQLTEGDLSGQFNPYLFATSFVEGDDIAAHDKKSVYEKMKSFVTSDTVQINIKNAPQFMIDNCCNFWLTSNDAAPFYLNEQSRRAFIHIPRRARADAERYHNLQLMFDSGEAGPTLLHYAREVYDEKNYTPVLNAPRTEGQKELALNSRTGAKEWIYDLVGYYEGLTRPYATIREIHALMESENVHMRDSTVDSLGHFLREAGAIRYKNGMQLTTGRTDGGYRRERVWILGDFEKLMLMDRKDLESSLTNTAFNFLKERKVIPIRSKK